MRLLFVALLALDGLFALPSMSVSQLHSDTSQVTIPDPTLDTSCDWSIGCDPNPGGCWTYAEDGTTVIVLTVDECLAVGVDQLWTPDPAWTMPPGWAECWPGYWAICEVTP